MLDPLIMRPLKNLRSTARRQMMCAFAARKIVVSSWPSIRRRSQTAHLDGAAPLYRGMVVQFDHEAPASLAAALGTPALALQGRVPPE